MGAQAPALRVDRGVLVRLIDQEGHAVGCDFLDGAGIDNSPESTLVRISDGHELCFLDCRVPLYAEDLSPMATPTHHESTPEVLVTFHPKTQVILLVRSGLQGVRPCKFRRRSSRNHIP